MTKVGLALFRITLTVAWLTMFRVSAEAAGDMRVAGVGAIFRRPGARGARSSTPIVETFRQHGDLRRVLLGARA